MSSINISRTLKLDETGTKQFRRPAKLLMDYLTTNWQLSYPKISQIQWDSWFVGKGLMSIRFLEVSTKPMPLNNGWSFYKFTTVLRLIFQAPYWTQGDYPDVITEARNEIDRLVEKPMNMTAFGISAIRKSQTMAIENYQERKRYKDPIADSELGITMIYSARVF